MTNWERTESSHKTREKNNTRWRHYTSSDNKETTTRSIGVLLDLYDRIWEEEIVPEG